MVWSQLEPTSEHLSYIVIAGFLTVYALFSVFIRNRLHLAEPPLALVTGIVFGPHGLDVIDPLQSSTERDDVVMELTRIIAGLQVFVVGLELPKTYIPKHYGSILWLLGPVMAFGWLICAAFIHFILVVDWPSALVISACLTPTDPVLAASILSNSHFSTRVPKRLKHLLSAESGCNDGVAFPFLYVGLSILTQRSLGGTMTKFFLTTILYQCVLGTIVGIILGLLANRAVRFSDSRKLIGPASFLAFYLVLAIFSIGIASTLGLDDFLVAFSAGVAFSHDGWFAQRTSQSNLNNILDILVNSTFFLFLGTIIPWSDFAPTPPHPITPARLLALLALVLLFRRIPAVLALKPFIPDLRTWTEALFAGHFGPMGVGALFLAIEARAQLETGTSVPLPSPLDPRADPRNVRASLLIFPVIAFIVVGSTLVHGLSVAAISLYIHFTRGRGDRAKVPGAEAELLGGMDGEEGDSEIDENGEAEEEWEERNNRILLAPED